MLNLDNIVSNKNTSSSENNNWPFRMLIIGPSGLGKTNTLFHLTQIIPLSTKEDILLLRKLFMKNTKLST